MPRTLIATDFAKTYIGILDLNKLTSYFVVAYCFYATMYSGE